MQEQFTVQFFDEDELVAEEDFKVKNAVNDGDAYMQACNYAKKAMFDFGANSYTVN